MPPARLEVLRDSYLAQARRKRLYGGVLLIVFVALLMSGFGLAEARNAGGFLDGLAQIGDFPAEVIAGALDNAGAIPGLMLRFLPSLVETVNIAGASTLLGALAAVVLSLLSTRGLARWPRLVGPFRRVMDILRALPEIVIALVLIFILGGGPVPAMIAIALHSTGALGKLFSEVNENADLKPVEGLASVGATWWQRMWLGILPQVAPNYFSYALLRFEINIRASAILGFVGSGGIGYDLKNAISWGQGRYDEVAAIFLLLITTIVVVDQFSGHVRHRLTRGRAGGHAGQSAAGPDQRRALRALFLRKRLAAFGMPAMILVYFAYIFAAFDLPALAERARLDNAAILLADTYSHKTHVTRDNRRGGITIAIEGETRGTYPPGEAPDWVKLGTDSATVRLPRGASVTMEGPVTRFDIPGYGLVRVTAQPGAVTVETPDGRIPDFINASDSRVTVTTPTGRLTVTRARSEVLRYSPGWELFFFTLDSPFHGIGLGELARLAVSGPPLVEGRGNLATMAGDFWNNQMWHHKEVAWALFETVLMAFLGTMGAMLVALPLAFMAAANFTVSRLLRFALRRVFDILRGVDALIWTIVLSRAFGPGPMTGALAILFTDSGTFGKLFSEALENVEPGQIEGVTSTGARPLQRYRFGVIPQIMPVLLSQTLYYLESNTRSATVIGAITGGGIGLLLTQAIATQKDWEEVSYYIVLIVLVVMLMDTLSGWLRRRLIRGA